MWNSYPWTDRLRFGAAATLAIATLCASGALPPPDPRAVHDAIADLIASFGPRYPRGPEWQRRAAELLARHAAATNPAALQAEVAALQREALLANPLLQGLKILALRRAVPTDRQLDGAALGLPQNWQGNCALRRPGPPTEIVSLELDHPDAPPQRIWAPEAPAMIADLELHFDARRLLFSAPLGPSASWQIFELDLDRCQVRQVTSGFPPSCDQYDPCYLADDDVIFASTACIAGVPCVGGGTRVANLFRCRLDGSGVRQLCFDQEHNWCPTLLEDGRVLYTRWEYTDTPHYFTRLLFTMNPDGTHQRALYGSNSYWPTSVFYARPIPGQPGRLIAIVSGHHGVARMGELVLFDVSRGDRDAEGAVQRIPGRAQLVPPVIADRLVDRSWPKFLHPVPLADPATGAGAGRYFLVSMKPSPDRPWGLWLADVFDNLVLLREDPDIAWLEPTPWRPSPRPPIIPPNVDLNRNDATVLIHDVYLGEPMRGVPRGTVRALRLFAYHYALPGTGGHIDIGIDGPWDARRILGTVPVEEDGSAFFRVPANIPIALQPLDRNGAAVQVMRSWFTAMPGENVSCVGCHERNAEVASPAPRAAFRREPSRIEPWYGPPRPFSFRREVQPVLDRRCVGCHDGSADRPDFRSAGSSPFRNFTPAYVALHPFVNRPGPESDYRPRPPMEYHADTSELVWLLRKGHHGVRLAPEEWDRLITWLDLNVPDHGTWTEQTGRRRSSWADLRAQLRATYAGIQEDWEQYPPQPPLAVTFQPPPPNSAPPRSRAGTAPPTTDETPLPPPPVRRFELAPGVVLEMVRLPSGTFWMGADDGADDERPAHPVTIPSPFWISRHEIPNAIVRLCDPAHDSGAISQYNKDHVGPGLPAHQPTQPAIRISWHSARAVCRWLSERIGGVVDLPTEAQWEYAARAGRRTPMWYGEPTVDFSAFANLADRSLLKLLIRDSPPWLPHAGDCDDRATGPAPIGRYRPNPWGLHDVHGNVAEWTRSLHRPYPYADDGRNDPAAEGPRVVRGGSWRDRPRWAAAHVRIPLPPWGRYATVGFRVVAESLPDPR
ncbi:MAG: SUMF1/EgtB/PvdO family nonheme iron enzyme [Kiritimatiellae bacterium]|nr:SUMF1/EgtB/PvdO family nonheme iron enzyme [Kiritimatiellia bacterium]